MKKQTALYIMTIALINAALLGNNDVVVTAKEEGFSAFHDLVMSAGLYNHAKKDAGAAGSLAPFTVFVPTNEAFEKIKDLDEKKKKKIITYHVVPGKKLESADNLMAELKSGVPSVGEKLVFAADNKIFLDESTTKASITKGPLNAKNGVLYVIDQVLLPADEVVTKTEKPAEKTIEKPVEKPPVEKPTNQTANTQAPTVAAPAPAPATTAPTITPATPAASPSTPIQLVMPMQMQQPEAAITEKTAQSLAATMTQLTQSIQLLIHVIQQAQNPTEIAASSSTPASATATTAAAKQPVIVV